MLSSPPAQALNGSARPCRKDDLAYQAVTIGAIVTLLVSVWVF